MLRGSVLTSWVNVGVKLGICGLAGLAIVALQKPRLQQLTATTIATDAALEEEALRLSILSRLPSFGFGNMLANWTFLNLVQYDGDTETRKVKGYELAPRYFETMTRFDPRFVDSYRFLSGILSYQMGRPEEAIALMNRGTEALTPEADPRAFVVWRLKGLDQLMMLGDTPAAAQSYDMAGNWALKSKDQEIREQTGPILKQTAEFLRTDPNNKLLALWSWTAVFDQATLTKDLKTQDRAREALFKIGAIEGKDEKGNPYFTLPQPSPQSSPEPSPKERR